MSHIDHSNLYDFQSAQIHSHELFDNPNLLFPMFLSNPIYQTKYLHMLQKVLYLDLFLANLKTQKRLLVYICYLLQHYQICHIIQQNLMVFLLHINLQYLYTVLLYINILYCTAHQLQFYHHLYMQYVYPKLDNIYQQEYVVGFGFLVLKKDLYSLLDYCLDLEVQIIQINLHPHHLQHANLKIFRQELPHVYQMYI